MMKFPMVFVCGAVFLASPMRAQFDQDSDGIIIARDDGWLRIAVESERIVRVAAARDRAFFERPSLVVLPRGEVAPRWQLTREAGGVTLATAQLRARVDLKTGAVEFLHAQGQRILAERPGTRELTVVPLGPELHYTDEKPADPITLLVYAGADGAFTLYEDDGVTYGYERGAFARIPLRWDDAKHMLTIGARTGTFPGMLAERTFEIVLAGAGKPVGFSFNPKPDRTVRYRGEPVTFSFP